MDINDCFNEYWEKHTEEAQLWWKTEPFLVGFKYGIQSVEYLESLKPFSPDNPTILYNMYEHYTVCKRLPEALKCINKLKELYPKYNEDWDLEIGYVEDFKEKIEKCENKKKVKSIPEFLDNKGRDW